MKRSASELGLRLPSPRIEAPLHRVISPLPPPLPRVYKALLPMCISPLFPSTYELPPFVDASLSICSAAPLPPKKKKRKQTNKENERNETEKQI